MKKLINKWFINATRDKLLHFIAGLIVGIIGASIGAITFKNNLGFDSFYGLPIWMMGWALGILVGGYKEVIHDLLLKKGKYEFYDWAYTIWGSMLSGFIIWVFELIK